MPNPGGGRGGVSFSEYYDIRKDPWQQTNLWLAAEPDVLSTGEKAVLDADLSSGASSAPARAS